MSGWFVQMLENARINMHYKQFMWKYVRLSEFGKAKLVYFIYTSLDDVINVPIKDFILELYENVDRNFLMLFINEIENGVTQNEKSFSKLRIPLKEKIQNPNLLCLALRFWICIFAAMFHKNINNKIRYITYDLKTINILEIKEAIEHFKLINESMGHKKSLENVDSMTLAVEISCIMKFMNTIILTVLS